MKYRKKAYFCRVFDNRKTYYNMKRSAFAIITFLLFAITANGQSIEEIQSSKDYIWGTGNASTLKKADNEALAALISQISTNVSSKFEQLTEGGTNGDQATVDETFKSVINTYSRATLNNTRRIVIQNEPEAVVMRYIKVAEIQKIFDGRKTKILDFVQEGMHAEKKHKWQTHYATTIGLSSCCKAIPMETSSLQKTKMMAKSCYSPRGYPNR